MLVDPTFGNSGTNPILIDAPTPIVTTFLHLMIDGKNISDIHPNQAKVLVDLYEKFEADTARDRLAMALYPQTQVAPWEVFVLASRLDNVQLAKVCIRDMRRCSWVILGQWSTENIQEATLPYTLGLINAIQKTRYSSSSFHANNNVIGTTGMDFEWDVCANTFCPTK